MIGQVPGNLTKREGLQQVHGHGADDESWTTVSQSAPLPYPHFSQRNAESHHRASAYTTVANFSDLSAAVTSNITVDVTANVYFLEPISISDVYGLVITSSMGSLFDGHNEVQMFRVLESSVEFHNITFINGYAGVSRVAACGDGFAL